MAKDIAPLNPQFLLGRINGLAAELDAAKKDIETKGQSCCNRHQNAQDHIKKQKETNTGTKREFSEISKDIEEFKDYKKRTRGELDKHHDGLNYHEDDIQDLKRRVFRLEDHQDRRNRDASRSDGLVQQPTDAGALASDSDRPPPAEQENVLRNQPSALEIVVSEDMKVMKSAVAELQAEDKDVKNAHIKLQDETIKDLRNALAGLKTENASLKAENASLKAGSARHGANLGGELQIGNGTWRWWI